MKIRAERAALADALAWVARAIPKNPPIPVLAGVRISASAGVIRLSAFDYETQHTAALEATIGDDGECVVPGIFLRDAISGGRGAEVDLILDGSRLEIASGRATYRAMCFEASDAPDLPPFPEVQGVISADRLRDAVAMVAPAISDDPTFPDVQGVHIEGSRETLTLIATDRFRFHTLDIPWDGDGSFEATIPGRQLVEATKGMVEAVEIGASQNLVGLSDGRHQWTTRRFDRPYAPRWRQVLTSTTERCIEVAKVDRNDLLGAVKQVGSMAALGRPVVLASAEGELMVRTPAQEEGEGSEVLDVEATSPVAIATNHRFLADALAVTTGPIEIRFGGSYDRGGPYVIADKSHPELTLIIQSKSMPGGTS